MGPWTFGGQSIWMMLIERDRAIPQLTEITEAMEPDVEFNANFPILLEMLAQDVVPGAHFAFLVSRPGSGFITSLDRRWAAALYAAAHHAEVTCEVVHLATRGAIRPIPPDELEVLATPA